MSKIVGNILNRLVTQAFPWVLITLAATALILTLSGMDRQEYQLIPVKSLSAGALGNSDPIKVANLLEETDLVSSVETRLSVEPFWILFNIPAAHGTDHDVIDFPSRHASEVTCWKANTGEMLGSGNRHQQSGGIRLSRGGFALEAESKPGEQRVVCQIASRGPARIVVETWTTERLSDAQDKFEGVAILIEAGIGVLAIFMLLTAAVNRSGLYLTFAGWLLLNMRMAALSAGTDYHYFGYAMPVDLVLPFRQGVVCAYYTMTIGLFSALFKHELQGFNTRWPLTISQISALAYFVAIPLLTYEQMLPILWVSTAVVAAVMVSYLILILKRTQSRVAVWYGASIVITLIASLNEVIAASTGHRLLMPGLNSVTAAIASALLASAAVAEHMRTHRLQTITAQKLLAQAYDDSPVGLFTIDGNLAVVKLNAAFRKMLVQIFGDPPKSMHEIFESSTIEQLKEGLEAGGGVNLQVQAVNHATATKCWCILRASKGEGGLIECSLQDIDERVQATERLDYLASHDPLTNCLNLRGLAERTSRRAEAPAALAYFDLDRFKLINDTYGHNVGNVMLKQVAQRIGALLSPNEFLSRVGGDEFVVVFYNRSVAESASACQSIISLIQTPFSYKHQSFSLDMSGGLVGLNSGDVDQFRESLEVAESLCRMAKKRTDQKVVALDSSDAFYQQYRDELELIECLEKGRTPYGLYILMQPEVSLTKPFEKLNFEVLVSLKKADGRVVNAKTIIEAAEAHGKTAIIDKWVTSTVVAWIEANAEQLAHTEYIGVNLSGGSINDEAFTTEFFSLLAAHPVARSKLRLEITEAVAVTDVKNTQRFVDKVRSYGCTILLDDFGAGYSSFSYLRALSADAIKIDVSLVRDAANSVAGTAMVKAISAITRSLNMVSIGEFAEDLATIKALAQAGVDYAQGYGICRAVEPQRIIEASGVADFINDPELLAYLRSIDSAKGVRLVT